MGNKMSVDVDPNDIAFKEFIKDQNIKFHKLDPDAQLVVFTSCNIPNDVATELADLARKGRLNVAMFFYKTALMEIQTALVAAYPWLYDPIKNLKLSLYGDVSRSVVINRLDDFFGVISIRGASIPVTFGFQTNPLDMLPDKWKELSAVAS